MTTKINIPLLILDFIILFPVTILRLVLIYLYGSRYNIELLDVLMHAETPKFNSGKNTVTTVKTGANNVLHKILGENKQIQNNTKNNIKQLLSDKSININSTSSSKIKTTTSKIETSIDDDLDKLTNMISGLIEQRKKVKNDKEKKKNEYEIEISTDSSIVENKFIEVDEDSTEQDSESFSFMFSEDRKKLNSLI